MQHPRFFVAITVALVIAACSAQPSAPPTPAAPAAPAAASATPVPAAVVQPAAPAAAAPKTLKAAMQGMEDDWKLIEKQLAANEVGDLPAMAVAARRVAAVMKLAYDPWDDKEVPDFGKLAREAEAAFLDLAAKAAAGDAAAVKAFAKTLQPQHCARCHDAFEAVHG